MDRLIQLGSGAARLGAALLLAALIGSGAASATEATHRTVRVPVLMYHRISAAPAHAALPHLWVAPRRFRAHLRTLHRHGWRTITADELGQALTDGRRIGRKRFVITIDDGARDGWSHARPILERFGMRATYCVVPGRAGRPWQLSFRHMRALRAEGHEIANHSLRHVDLRALSPNGLRRQVVRARRLIRDRVGRAPRSFCYPMGLHDARVRRAVRVAGHTLAFTTMEGTHHSLRDAMRSPRVRVNGSSTPAQLLARVRP